MGGEVSAESDQMHLFELQRLVREPNLHRPFVLHLDLVDVCREEGISDATYYRWKAQYGGLEVNQLRRLRLLEEENRKLKQIVADLTLDNQALKDITAKNW